MNQNECDVLVVGLGPVGGVLSGLLRTEGLSVIAIDREADIYPLPRAAAFDDEAMRVFQTIGLAETLLPSCRVMTGYQLLTAAGEIMLKFDIPDQVGPNGWAATYAFHQPDIERPLRARLKELGVELRLSTTLTSLIQDERGVTAHVTNSDGEGTIRAKYIVGCDGANSKVREIIGAGVFDYDFSESWLVVDAIIEHGEDLPNIGTQLCDPAQPTTFMHISGTRYRWEFMLKPGDDPQVFCSDETLARLLKPWNKNDRIKIERRALYRFRGLLANKWRSDRLLIAGDAAHLMPPFLGQGMCSGIRDSFNLGWKLSAVIRGEASDTLLDTYQQERDPHVRGIIEQAIGIGQVICMLDPEMAAQRDAGMLEMRAAGQTPPLVPLPPLQNGCLMGGPESGALFIQPVVGDRRMDTHLGEGPWLLTIKAAIHLPGTINQFVIGSEALGPFSAQVAAWLKERAADAVLVRPDRHIFGVGDADSLITAWQNKLSDLEAQRVD